MTFTRRQIALLSVALTNFYDEIAKTSTSNLKEEIMELSKVVQDSYSEAQQ